MNDPADHPAVIDARLAARVVRQVPLDPCELLLRKPEKTPTHYRLPLEALNHKPDPSGIPFMGPEPSLQGRMPGMA
jgi:hypothetical protein